MPIHTSQSDWFRRRSSGSSASSRVSARKSSWDSTPAPQFDEDIFDATSVQLNVLIHRSVPGTSLGGRFTPHQHLTMTSTPPTPSGLGLHDLSLFVLLPASAHSHHIDAITGPPVRPSPLKSRQSGSTIPSLKSLAAVSKEPESIGGTADSGIVVNAGRRLSLAPGLGSGVQPRGASSSRLDPITAGKPTSSASTQETISAPSSSRAPAFGSRTVGAEPTSSGGRSRRRPQTAQTGTGLASPAPGPTFAPVSRGSIAVTNSRGLLGGPIGRTRPGWEGDEVVGMLRGGGMEVTIIRHAAQLPSILSPTSTSPQYVTFNRQAITARPLQPASSSSPSSRSSTPFPGVTPVVLIPLSDSLTIPSLSLLLQQGTTPTAVCFQQDILDRAKRSEEEWLPAALAQIREIVEMRDKATQEAIAKGTAVETPIILAYSANPALSTSTISACVHAGVSGVLKPPYDVDTARLVRRMIRAAKDGRISSVVGLPGYGARSSSPDDAGSHKVILPPTALSRGGEHEGEKVLSGAYRMQHRRGTSADIGSLLVSSSSSGRQRENSAPVRKQSLQPVQTSMPPSSSVMSVTPTTATMHAFDHPERPPLEHKIASLLVYNPPVEQRRRSVDVSGLEMALNRAQRAFEAVQPKFVGTQDDTAFGKLVGQEGSEDCTEHDEDVCLDTQLAELLSAMFYQTLVAIDVEMDEYESFATPIDRAHRDRLVDALATWDFKPHYLDDGDLFRVACILFEGILHSEGLVDLQLQRDQINRLLFAIRAIYHAPNPYHNYVHAIDVLQATYSFLVNTGLAPPYSYIREMGPNSTPWKRPTEEESGSLGPGSRRARQVFRPQDVFGMMIAAMGHDVGHPGLSNAFMKNAKTPLSQVYEDKSVLENMHCMLIVQLLRKHGFGFLITHRQNDVDTESIPARAQFDTKGFRQVLYSSVLATDMSLHFVWMQDLQRFGEKISREDGVYAPDVDVGPGGASDEGASRDRIMIAQAFIKCADISNPTRPIDVSEHWSTVLLKEWAVQASLETDLELPVSVIASADAALQAKGQIGFIKLFTQPLFDAVSDVLPELQCYADWCAQNHDIWETRSEKLKESEDTTIVQPAVEDASYDERFSTLFPLSLPTSLVESRSLEPGPLATAIPSIPQTPATPLTPRRARLADTPSTTNAPAAWCVKYSESPSAKAIRAVYHANLSDTRYRPVGVCSGVSGWSKGVPIPGLQPSTAYLDKRRSSSPGVVAAGW